jgi:chloramphenicol 3-O phosphotransferase
MKPGQIIFLNGTSSAGKTSIAKELQERLQEPYMLLSLDAFFLMYPEKAIDPQTKSGAEVFVRLVPGVVEGFHKAAAALASTGNNLIIDHVLQEDEWLDQCLQCLAEYSVLFVGVKCPLNILSEREKQRSDREPGTAEYQFSKVHADRIYDVEVDTSVLSPEHCADEIMRVLADPAAGSGFAEMRKRRTSGQ